MEIGTHSQHLSLVKVKKREVVLRLLVKVFQHVVGVANGLVGCRPHVRQSAAQVVVGGVLVFGQCHGTLQLLILVQVL